MDTTQHELMGTPLQHCIDDHASSALAALEVTRCWLEVVDTLQPVMGAETMRLLFSRSTHILAREEPQLAELLEDADAIEALAERVATLNPAQARFSGRTFLAAVYKSLVDLVGESTARKLLQTIRRPDEA